jgi:hypothetical protein
MCVCMYEYMSVAILAPWAQQARQARPSRLELASLVATMDGGIAHWLGAIAAGW